jgi:16S rRNA (cytidine1402-2'-O)-methyltransferase
MSTGTLYLLPCNLSEPIRPPSILPAEALQIAQGIEHVVAENAKTARAFLKAVGVQKPIADISIVELNARTATADVPRLLDPLRNGQDVALVSEAGAPGVADPGALLVAAAHDEGLRVRPLVGPSSILLSLMAAGLEGQRFAFHGYLPSSKPERLQTLRELERASRRHRMTQIFIETPYRNDVLLTDLLAALDAATRLCIARDLTGSGEHIATKTIAQWRLGPQKLGKVPAIFLFLA